MKRLLKKDIDKRIHTFTNVLVESMRHIDGNTGWHQHLKSPKIGIVATSMALLYFNQANAHCLEKAHCLDFIRSKVREDGGWAYISNATTISNIESTCWAILALYDCDPDRSSSLIENGANWILSSLDNHNKDNGWGFAKDSNPRIYITAFALRTLYKLNKSLDPRFESAKQWLIDSQNTDGGWGALPVNGSSIFFTCYCISTLISIGFDPNAPIVRNAHTWLDKQLAGTRLDDVSLVCYMEFIEAGEGTDRIRIPFFHYTVPSIAKAYINLGCSNSNLFKALYTLMKRSRDGLIEHPNLEHSRIYPIWALYETSTALIDFKKSQSVYWSKSYVFCCILNRIYSYKFWSPLRLITFFSNWTFGALGIFGVVFLITWFSEPIIEYWNSIQNKFIGGVVVSLTASIIYTLCAGMVKLLKKTF